MAFATADRCKETTVTTGTGTYSLDGAVAGFRTLVAGLATGNRCVYCVENGTDWEINEGTITDATPDTLTRDLLLASSTGSAINWAAGTKYVSVCYSAAHRNPRTKKLTTQHDNSTATGTIMTSLSLANVQPGTYTVKYTLIHQAAATTTGAGFAINFTGTATTKVFARRNVATITTASNGLAEEESGAALVTGGVLNGWATNTYATTAANMVSEGVGAINTNTIEIIEGVLVVTAAGSLDIWHASQVAAISSVMVGSSVVLTRIDD